MERVDGSAPRMARENRNGEEHEVAIKERRWECRCYRSIFQSKAGCCGPRLLITKAQARAPAIHDPYSRILYII